MADTNLQELLSVLNMRVSPSGANAGAPAPDAIAAASNSRGEDLAGEMGHLAAQIEQLRQATAIQIDSLQGHTEAISRTEKRDSSGGVAGVLGHVFSSTLASGFGLAPLFSGLFGLFGSGSKPDPASPLPKFSLPEAVNVEAGITGSREFAPAGYAQDGRVRAVPAQAQQIQIHVNAMDSRSFMDRSDDIAKAVKEAMLNSHSLNDVVADL
ncbi:MAG TPA: hypothetical protein VMZ52_03515 [Bryobacteraceae bacterium]|nr:hypothetical protein [Bryobacteraceae bacterium]